MFPILTRNLEEVEGEETDLRPRLFSLTAFIMRAGYLPNVEYQEIGRDTMEEIVKDWYRCFEAVFGSQNATYNCHLFAHIPHIRESLDAPLTACSAFRAESFYGEARTRYCPGTPNSAAQILKGCFLKVKVNDHHCNFNLLYKSGDTTGKKLKDNLVYVFHEGIFHYYEIDAVNEHKDHPLICTKLVVSEYSEDYVALPWAANGVAKLEGRENVQTRLFTGQIDGKCSLVYGNIIMTACREMLSES